MNTRRKFLIKSSTATAAVLALKPFKAISRVAGPFIDFSGSHSKLIFLHTANLNPAVDYKVVKYIKDIKNKNANAILLHAGQADQKEASQLSYDVTAVNGDYEIIERGNLRTGVISAKPGEGDIINKIKTLSTFLKKERKCTIVVCLSQLGYKNNNKPDDVALASQTTHLDVIIGGHPDNFKANPVIALNKNKEEVIIHSASGGRTGFGKIEFDFDNQGLKKNLSLNNHSSINTTPKRITKVA